jgi:hypothetical protein
MPDRLQKITFAEMRDMGARGSPILLSQFWGFQCKYLWRR